MIKRMITAMLLTLLLVQYPVISLAAVSVEELPMEAEPLLEPLGDDLLDGYLFEFRGEKYVVGRGYTHYPMPIKYDESIPFKEYIWTGEDYMVRRPDMDGAWPGGSVKPFPVQFYDENFNLVAEHRFEGWHISAIGYYNGTYYCELYSTQYPVVMKSTDMVNWEETDEKIPRQIDTITYTDDQAAFAGYPLTSVNYEGETNTEFVSTMGEWILRQDENYNFYLSNDNIYFVKIDAVDIGHDLSRYDLQCIYEYGDDIVIDLRNWDLSSDNYLGLLRLRVPKQDIYNELDVQKTAPYVCVNNAILGFETPPVTESDRTLVPMRFLFEQLGADVTWDEATETATAKKANTTINFSIDNTTATVNGAATTMDVPARLVGDKTMVPLRFLSEEMGCTVEWDEETRLATVITE